MSTRRRQDSPAPLSQRELDILKVLAPVLEGQRTHAEAARRLGMTPRHIRRLLGRIRDGGGDDTKKGPYRPAANHPWRRTLLTGTKPDISNGG